MPNQRERRTKRRLNSSQVDPNEGGSSQEVSGRTLRSRGQKRAPSGDIEGGSNGSSSNSSDDEVEDETFRVEHRTGKSPAENDSEDEEEGVAGADGSDDDEGDGSEDDDADDAEPPVINRPRYPFGRAPINYFGDGMTETVKRLRRKNPYTKPKIARDARKTLTPRDGNTSDVTLFQRNLMAAMRPGSPQFSVVDFIWQEIKNFSENPQKICSYSPYIMYMIKKTIGTNFPGDVSHKPFEAPSAAQEEEEIRQEQPDTQHGAGLTGSPDRSDRFRSGQHSHSHRQHEKPSSPIKKIINFLVGMCKSQRDIEVEQKRQWRASKKERNSIKMMHNPMHLQPPRSQISPTPPEVEVPSVEARLSGYLNPGNFDQYGSIFYQPHGPQDRGYFGSASADHFYSVIYGQQPPTYAAPPPPPYGTGISGDIPSSSHGAESYQGMPPPPHPHRPFSG
ncbi:hypothetical protein C2845_PM11G18380 [Panicum miliaceum]|uniref:Uncharacterized protein n=1 Tax=Panicum miliaceum TaxID=4540 RepID=A0A3L6RUJ5_PANMI|nr:hypothetical protein C2845_PM11G18380 [Panicum miliaceum]